MPQVRVLDKELAELIAAGEVIERPSSVIKELVENSIDSGASVITVEIKRGGVSYIRITDNGCGMSYDEVPTAFLRHATSKIKDKNDLTNILTLGFRGEALASICAVSKTEIFTRPANEEFGTHYVIEGTVEKLYEKSGCPEGTTIIIRDIFYNVPARLKFLKKDQYEGNNVASLVNKIAVSHPEICFRFIRDNRQELFTPGDNQLFSAIYSVFGKEFAASLLPVNYRMNGISVSGYTVKPLWSRKNRTMQHFYVNGRYVKSLTCMYALEEAYRNCIMEGKFPACVLNIEIPPNIVDVNVHPAKIEVRFSDDKLIYDCVYFAVKNAVLADQKPAEIVVPEHKRTAEDYAMPVFTDSTGEQTAMEDTSVSPKSVTVPIRTQASYVEESKKQDSEYPPFQDKLIIAPRHVTEIKDEDEGQENNPPLSNLKNSVAAPSLDSFKYINSSSLEKHSQKEDAPDETTGEGGKPKSDIYFRIIGEAFKNYAIAETEDGLLIVDKHAAHERINFERLRTGKEHLTCQTLLEPVKLRLDYSEYDALMKNADACEKAAFLIEPLEAPYVLVKGIPTMLQGVDAGDVVTELAEKFAAHRHDPLPERIDDMYHTIACRSAIKANDITDTEELKSLIAQILADERIRYCPHGRPVMFRLSKKELEKQFRRIV